MDNQSQSQSKVIGGSSRQGIAASWMAMGCAMMALPWALSTFVEVSSASALRAEVHRRSDEISRAACVPVNDELLSAMTLAELNQAMVSMSAHAAKLLSIAEQDLEIADAFNDNRAKAGAASFIDLAQRAVREDLACGAQALKVTKVMSLKGDFHVHD